MKYLLFTFLIVAELSFAKTSIDFVESDDVAGTGTEDKTAPIPSGKIVTVTLFGGMCGIAPNSSIILSWGDDVGGWISFRGGQDSKNAFRSGGRRTWRGRLRTVRSLH